MIGSKTKEGGDERDIFCEQIWGYLIYQKGRVCLNFGGKGSREMFQRGGRLRVEMQGGI